MGIKKFLSVYRNYKTFTTYDFTTYKTLISINLDFPEPKNYGEKNYITLRVT